jgi:arylsulfatase A-like enzyme
MSRRPRLLFGLISVLVIVAAAVGCSRESSHEGASINSEYDSTVIQQTRGADAVSDTSRFYDGTKSVRVNYSQSACSQTPCDGVAQFVYNVSPSYASLRTGYYGAAFYLPSDFYAKQQGRYIELLRWKDTRTGDKGGVAIFSDGTAHLFSGVGGATEGSVNTIGPGFTIPTARWVSLYVFQVLRTPSSPKGARNQVFVNGTKVVDVDDQANSAGESFNRLAFGLVENSPVTSPGPDFEFWFDRSYASISEPPPPVRPNILFIISDDQPANSVLPGVMDRTRQWFKDGGTYFPDAYSTTPLCCPARATIFSGRLNHNNGVQWNGDPYEDDDLDHSLTVQRYLHDAGYETGFIGKFLNDWSIYRNPPYWDHWAITGPVAFNDDGVWKARPVDETGKTQFLTDHIRDEALQFIDGAEQDDSRPWFLYVAPISPHLPEGPAPRDADAPVPAFTPDASYFEPDISDKPDYVSVHQAQGLQNPTQAQLDECVPYDPRTPNGLVQCDRQKQLRSLMSVDDMVDAIFNELAAKGEDRDTLAFFITDNAFELGGHGLVGKGWPYTESVQIPFFVRWPARQPTFPPGKTDDDLVGINDLTPTALDAAGIEPQVPTDGISLLDPFVHRDRIHLEYWASNQGFSWASTRTKDYQYTEYYQNDATTPEAAPNDAEYYDLKNDPLELVNLLRDGDPSTGPDAAERASLSTQLAKDRLCVGKQCPPGRGADSTRDMQKPTVSLLTPPAGSVGGIVPLTAHASDNVGVQRVDFRLGGANGPLIGSDTQGPFKVAWDTSALPKPSQQSVTAIAYDAASVPNASDPDTVSVTLDGSDVQTNIDSGEGGAGAGKFDVGDVITLKFPRPVNPNSIVTAWTGAEERDVTVTLTAETGPIPLNNDMLSFSGINSSGGRTALGEIDLGGRYMLNRRPVQWSVAAEMWIPLGKPDTVKVRITGTPGLIGGAGEGTMIWTVGSATDTSGQPFCDACEVTESAAGSGAALTLDREF